MPKIYFNRIVPTAIGSTQTSAGFPPENVNRASIKSEFRSANLSGSQLLNLDFGQLVKIAGVFVSGLNSDYANIIYKDASNTFRIANIFNYQDGFGRGKSIDFAKLNISGGDFVGRDRSTTGISPRDLEPLFAPLRAAIAAQAPAGVQGTAMRQVEQLKAEVAKGRQANDGKVATMVDGLVGLVPGAVSAVVSAFASPILGGIAGPVTKFVLDKLQPN